MRSFAFTAAGLATVAHAFTQPGANTWGPLLRPDLSDPVTQGEKYTVTWDPSGHPTDGVTVSLVLCHGSSANCVTDSTAIVEGVPAAQKTYEWDVPCSLAPGTQNTDTGYGMLVIVDGTGEFQYSTQFSVLENPACAGSGSSSSTTTTGGSSSSSSSSSSTTTTPSGHGSTTGPYGGWNSTTTASFTSSSGPTGPHSVPTTITTATVSESTGFPSASPVQPTASSPVETLNAAVRDVVGKAAGVIVVGAAAMLAL